MGLGLGRGCSMGSVRRCFVDLGGEFRMNIRINHKPRLQKRCRINNMTLRCSSIFRFGKGRYLGSGVVSTNFSSRDYFRTGSVRAGMGNDGRLVDMLEVDDGAACVKLVITEIRFVVFIAGFAPFDPLHLGGGLGS